MKNIKKAFLLANAAFASQVIFASEVSSSEIALADNERERERE